MWSSDRICLDLSSSSWASRAQKVEIFHMSFFFIIFLVESSSRIESKSNSISLWESRHSDSILVTWTQFSINSRGLWVLHWTVHILNKDLQEECPLKSWESVAFPKIPCRCVQRKALPRTNTNNLWQIWSHQAHLFSGKWCTLNYLGRGHCCCEVQNKAPYVFLWSKLRWDSRSSFSCKFCTHIYSIIPVGGEMGVKFVNVFPLPIKAQDYHLKYPNVLF